MNAFVFPFIAFLSFICFNINAHEVVLYEYGAHVPGDQVAFISTGIIPAYTPVHTLNLTHNGTYFVKNYTYVRVEYHNSASKVFVSYNPLALTLTFHIKLPFVETEFQVEAYALPVELVKKMEEEKKLKNHTVPPSMRTAIEEADKAFLP